MIASGCRSKIAIYGALERYAATAEGTGRFFSGDCLPKMRCGGFAFIDLCRKSYSVMLMNPPFGAGSLQTRSMLSSAYPRTKNDVYAAFVRAGSAAAGSLWPFGGDYVKNGVLSLFVSKMAGGDFAEGSPANGIC